MCRSCCEYELISCKCTSERTRVGYAVPCCRNDIHQCDPCIIHQGMTDLIRFNQTKPCYNKAALQVHIRFQGQMIYLCRQSLRFCLFLSGFYLAYLHAAQTDFLSIFLFLGCSVFDNCKRCNNGTWQAKDDFYISESYCTECRQGWSGGDCLSECLVLAQIITQKRLWL